MKNSPVNHMGSTPSQWVLGQQPPDVTSIISDDFDETLGALQILADIEDGEVLPQDKFMMQLLVRQRAKEAYVKVDAHNASGKLC